MADTKYRVIKKIASSKIYAEQMWDLTPSRAVEELMSRYEEHYADPEEELLYLYIDTTNKYEENPEPEDALDIEDFINAHASVWVEYKNSPCTRTQFIKHVDNPEGKIELAAAELYEYTHRTRTHGTFDAHFIVSIDKDPHND